MVESVSRVLLDNRPLSVKCENLKNVSIIRADNEETYLKSTTKSIKQDCKEKEGAS